MIIDGRALAQSIEFDLKHQVESRRLSPKLAIILANTHEASAIYVRRKMKTCEDIGIEPVLHHLPVEATQTELENLIDALNHDSSVHGVFLQLPLPDHLDSNALINRINPHKDVDGLTHVNLGKIMAGDDSGLAPCTPQGVMKILGSIESDLTGKHAVIIGRSLLFGKPMGQLLLNANCTVTQCHSKTINLPEIAATADILIAATGQAKMVKANWVKDGATVIDVGITRMDNGTLSGDIDFDDVKDKAAHITPVPGGVGPMTVACLMANTVKACQNLKTT